MMDKQVTDQLPKLRPQWRKFAEAYLGKCMLNATQAAIEAGYSERSAHTQGYRLMKNDEVSAYIEARMKQLKMSTDEIHLRIAQQARAEYADYIEAETGAVDLVRMAQDGKLHLVKGIKWDRLGNRVVEFYDAHTALVDLAKFNAMFKDQEQPQVNVYIEGLAELAERVYGDTADSQDDAGD